MRSLSDTINDIERQTFGSATIDLVMIGNDNHVNETKTYAFANPSSICSKIENAVVMITYDETDEIKTILVSIMIELVI